VPRAFLYKAKGVTTFDGIFLPLADDRHPSYVASYFLISVVLSDGGHFRPSPQERSRGRRTVHWVSAVEGEDNGSLVAAWVSASWEGRPDAAIHVAHFSATERRWSEPQQVAPNSTAAPASGRGSPPRRGSLWHPALCWVPRGAEGRRRLLLLFKRGSSAVDWEGMQSASDDGGVTWSPPAPMRFSGPAGVGAFHRCHTVPGNGGTTVVAASSLANLGSQGVHIEYSTDGGESWARTATVPFPKGVLSKPSLFPGPDGGLRLLAQNRPFHPRPAFAKVHAAISVGSGNGTSWTVARELDSLPMADSPLDALRLADGRLMAVYNHGNAPGFRDRNLLVVALSHDGGEHWMAALAVDHDSQKLGRELANPSIAQTSDGLVHILYVHSSARTAPGPMTGRENLRHVVLNPTHLRAPESGKGTHNPANARGKRDQTMASHGGLVDLADPLTKQGAAASAESLAGAGLPAGVARLQAAVWNRTTKGNHRKGPLGKAAGKAVSELTPRQIRQKRREQRRKEIEWTRRAIRVMADRANSAVDSWLAKPTDHLGYQSAEHARLDSKPVIYDEDITEFDNSNAGAGTEG